MSEAESDVRIRRAELGLGQAELARLVGVAPSYVWKIEHGTRVPSVEVLPKLAKALEVPEAFFAPLFVGLLWRTRPGFRVALPALRDERIRLELQQQEVANRAGVSPGHLSQVERAEKPASPELQARLAAIYDRAVDELFAPAEGSARRCPAPTADETRPDDLTSISVAAETCSTTQGKVSGWLRRRELRAHGVGSHGSVLVSLAEVEARARSEPPLTGEELELALAGWVDTKTIAASVPCSPNTVRASAAKGELAGLAKRNPGPWRRSGRPWLFMLEAAAEIRRQIEERTRARAAAVSKWMLERHAKGEHRGRPRTGKELTCGCRGRRCSHKSFYRTPSQIRPHNFSSKSCANGHRWDVGNISKGQVGPHFSAKKRKKHEGNRKLFEVREEGRHKRGEADAMKALHLALLIVQKKPQASRSELTHWLVRGIVGPEALYNPDGTERKARDPKRQAATKLVTRRLDSSFRRVGVPPELDRLFPEATSVHM